jgi:hypothetical protein
LGDWDWENWSSRPAWANSWQDHISKITRAKWTGGMAQAEEPLLYCFTWGLSEFKLQSHLKKIRQYTIHTFFLLSLKIRTKGFFFSIVIPKRVHCLYPSFIFQNTISFLQLSKSNFPLRSTLFLFNEFLISMDLRYYPS